MKKGRRPDGRVVGTENGGVLMAFDDKKRQEIASEIISFVAKNFLEHKEEAIVALFQTSEYFQIATGIKVTPETKKEIIDRLTKTVGPQGNIAVDFNQDRWEAQRHELMYG